MLGCFTNHPAVSFSEDKRLWVPLGSLLPCMVYSRTILRTVQDFYEQTILVARQHRESFLDVEEKLWKALIQFSHEAFRIVVCNIAHRDQ